MSMLRAQLRLRRSGFELDVNFDVPARGVTALFGPSGSGKTTVLRCIAGLEHAAQGTLDVDGECWQDEARRVFLPAHQRRVGYMFQEARLFPHLTVRGNLGYGLRRTPPDARRIAFEQAVEWAGIGPLLGRRTPGLSGGERSRVALARTLLTSPRLLLLDEPLAALDHAARAEILPYLERLNRELATPMLYVSHTIDEVARLADFMVCLERGRVSAVGPVPELLTRLDLPLAHGDEAAAILDAVVVGLDTEFHLAELGFAGGRMRVADAGLLPGMPLRVRILARDVSLSLSAPQQTSILNILPARVVEIQADRPAQALIQLDVGGALLLARITRKSVALLGLEPGHQVYAQVKSVALLR
jgi:molybdate transport system ATP-binding protein